MSRYPEAPSLLPEQQEPEESQRVVIRPTNSRQRVVVTLENASSEPSIQGPQRHWVQDNDDRQENTGAHEHTADGTNQRYVYIPSTSSFSRESPPPAPIIIQQPPSYGYPRPGTQATQDPSLLYPNDYSSYEPQQYTSPPSHHGPPIIIQSDYSSRGDPPIVVQPAYGSRGDPPFLVHPAYGSRIDTPYYDGRSSIKSTSDEAASTFVAVDPFRSSHTKYSFPIAQSPGFTTYPPSSTQHYVVFPYTRRRVVFLALLKDFVKMFFTFFFDTLPRQLYLHLLLRLPSFYFSRVARIFEEAEMTLPEIKKMALQGMDPFILQQGQWSSPASVNLKSTWESFIDSLLREWKTLNIVSVLLLSAILTILQIESAGADPITRNCALISLVCSLMSLLYGCMYIIRFSSMRKTYKALEWAQEAQRMNAVIWWNVWVLLAMPATWLAWSIILYIACIMSFVWRTGTVAVEPGLVLSPRAELGVRIAISVVMGLGALYFLLILNTLRRYGDSMDEKFRLDLSVYVKESKLERRSRYPPSQTRTENSTGTPPGSQASWRPFASVPMTHNPQTTPSFVSPPSHIAPPLHTPLSYTMPPRPIVIPPPNTAPSSRTTLPLYMSDTAPSSNATKVMDLHFHNRSTYDVPYFLVSRIFKSEDWERFTSEALLAWDGQVPMYQTTLNMTSSEPLRPQDSVAQVLARWNRKHFNPRKTMALLCHEYIDLFPYSPAFAIYLVDTTSEPGQPLNLGQRFGAVPQGLTRIDIFDQPGLGRSRRRILGRTSIFSSVNPVDARVHFPGHAYDQPQRRRSYSRSRSRSRSRSEHTPYRRQPHSRSSRSSRTNDSYQTRSSTGRRSPSRSHSRSRSPTTKQSSLSTPYHTKRFYSSSDSSRTSPRVPTTLSTESLGVNDNDTQNRSSYEHSQAENYKRGSTTSEIIVVSEPRRGKSRREDNVIILNSASKYNPARVKDDAHNRSGDVRAEKHRPSSTSRTVMAPDSSRGKSKKADTGLTLSSAASEFGPPLLVFPRPTNYQMEPGPSTERPLILTSLTESPRLDPTAIADNKITQGPMASDRSSSASPAVPPLRTIQVSESSRSSVTEERNRWENYQLVPYTAPTTRANVVTKHTSGRQNTHLSSKSRSRSRSPTRRAAMGEPPVPNASASVPASRSHRSRRRSRSRGGESRSHRHLKRSDGVERREQGVQVDDRRHGGNNDVAYQQPATQSRSQAHSPPTDTGNGSQPYLSWGNSTEPIMDSMAGIEPGNSVDYPVARTAEF